MKLVNAVSVVIVIMGLALVSSGCTVRVENLARNNTSRAGEALALPVYPNATQTSFSIVPFVGQIVTYQTNDTPSQVLDFYKSQMQDRGYNISRSFISTNETGGLVIFGKGQDTVWVTIGTNDGTTDIAVRTSFQR